MKRVLASFVVLMAMLGTTGAHAELNANQTNIIGCSGVPSCPGGQRSIYMPGDDTINANAPDDGQGVFRLVMDYGSNLNVRNADLGADYASGNFCKTAAEKVECHTLTSDRLVTPFGVTCAKFVPDECEYVFTSYSS